MKKTLLIASLFIFTAFTQVKYYPPFARAEALIKNVAGELNIVYREGGSFRSLNEITNRQDLRIKNIVTGTDSLLAEEYLRYNGLTEISGHTVAGFGFTADNTDSFYFAGTEKGALKRSFIKAPHFFRYYPGSEITFFHISAVTAGKITLVMNDTLMISEDYGMTFQKGQIGFRILAVNPVYDNEIFAVKEGFLYKGYGVSGFFRVDTDNDPELEKIHFSPDGQTVYKTQQPHSFSGTYSLIKSEQRGNPFTWNYIREFDGKPLIFPGRNLNNMIWVAVGNQLFEMDDIPSGVILPVRHFDNPLTSVIGVHGTDKLILGFRDALLFRTTVSSDTMKKVTIPDELKNFYPLRQDSKIFYRTTGWTYNGGPTPEYYDFRSLQSIGRDTLIEPYGIFTTISGTNFGGFRLQKYDPLSAKVLALRVPFITGYVALCTKLDLLMQEGETDTLFPLDYGEYKVTNTANYYTEKFGRVLAVRKFTFNSLHYNGFYLLEGFGIDTVTSEFDFGADQTWINGAIIEGVIYGDTVLTGTDDPENTFPTGFEVYPNYPNPFNGSTIIRFNLPASGDVGIKVYSLNGELLINEEISSLSSGKHEISFNTLYNMSSGIYIVRLFYNQSSRVIKLLLLK